MSSFQPAWTGAALVMSLAAWIGVVTVARGAAADLAAGARIVGLLLLTGVALLAARRVAEEALWLPLAVVAGLATAVAVWQHDTVLDSPLGGPLGYANATAAFYVQAAAAALVLVVVARAWPLRLTGGLAAAVAATIPWANGSVAGAVLVTALPVGLAGLVGPRVARAIILGAAAAFLAVTVATVVLGLADEDDQRLPAALTDRRVTLWHDALVLMGEQPLLGVGPGRFAEESPTALGDPDAAWAHNEFLELGAETGVAGLALSVTLVVWGFTLLWFTPPGAGPAIGAIALAAFGIHASIDYVAHSPALPLTVAVVVGTVSAGGAQRSLRPDRASGDGR